MYRKTKNIEAKLKNLIEDWKKTDETTRKREVFLSYSEVARAIGVGDGYFVKNPQMRKLLDESKMIQKRNVKEDLEELINKHKKRMKLEKAKPFLSYAEVARALNVRRNYFSEDKQSKKLLDESGVLAKRNIKKELEKLIKEREKQIKLGKVKPFLSYVEVANMLKLGDSYFNCNTLLRKLLDKSGILAKRNIEEELKKLIKERKKQIELGEKEPFSSYSKVAQALMVGNSYFTENQQLKKILDESGILFIRNIEKELKELIANRKKQIELGEKNTFSSYFEVTSALQIRNGYFSCNRLLRKLLDESGILTKKTLKRN